MDDVRRRTVDAFADRRALSFRSKSARGPAGIRGLGTRRRRTDRRSRHPERTRRAGFSFLLPRRVLNPLPLGRATTLVVKAEVAGREPPLDRASQRRPPAPAVGVTAAFSVSRVVNSLDEASLHAWTVAREP